MNISSMSQFYRDRKAQGIEYAAKHISQLGFDSVEWFETDHTEHIENAEYAKNTLEQHGLSVSCYTVLVSLYSPDQGLTEAHMLDHVQTASALGAKYFQHTIFPPVSLDGVENTFEEVFDGIIDLAERIARHCNRLGMVCIYEPQGVYFNGIGGMGKLLEELRNRGCTVGICGDSANSCFVDVAPEDFFKSFAWDIYHVHVKDVLVSHNEIAADKVRRSIGGAYICGAELGEGSVDLKGCFEALREVGYDGAVSFEFGGSDELIRQKQDYVTQIIKESEQKL